MTLRLRFPQGRLVRRQRQEWRYQREMAQTATSLLTPLYVMAYVLAFWRLAADMGLAGEPGLQGLAAHWQLWLITGLGLQVVSRTLTRVARAEAEAVAAEAEPHQATR